MKEPEGLRTRTGFPGFLTDPEHAAMYRTGANKRRVCRWCRRYVLRWAPNALQCIECDLPGRGGLTVPEILGAGDEQ